MKMEVGVHSDHAGTVTWIGCRPGQVVAAGQPLFGVAPGA
jgi:urea carboxylase